jgi:hypothetical protein
MRNRKKGERDGKALKKKTESRVRSYDPLGPDILWKYPGKYIVYSEDEGRVIGVGDTEKEAFDQAEASGVKGLWHSSYSPPPGVGFV